MTVGTGGKRHTQTVTGICQKVAPLIPLRTHVTVRTGCDRVDASAHVHIIDVDWCGMTVGTAAVDMHVWAAGCRWFLEMTCAA